MRLLSAIFMIIMSFNLYAMEMSGTLNCITQLSIGTIEARE